MGEERRNDNFTPSLSVKSNAGDGADVVLWADPTTHRLLVTVTGAGSGGTSAVDDSAFVAGSDAGTPMMGFATSDSVDSGDVGVVGMTTARAMFVYIKGSDVATGGTSMVDDAPFTAGTTAGTPAFAVFDDTTPDSVDEGDGGALRMSANRNLYVTIRDASGNERGVQVNASNQLLVTGPVTNAGTFVVQENGAALTALQLIDDTVATLGTTTYTEATTKGLVIGAVRRDANTSLVDTTNEIAPLQVNATGELKVAVIQALPTGSNVIGALTANQSVNVAQMNGVTVTMGNGVAGTGVQRVTLASDSTGNIATIGTSVTPGTAAANLGKARDAVAGASDTGVAMLYVRRDTPTAVTPAAGDYESPQISANGEQWVRLAGELADDAAFTPATTRVVPVGFFADETSTDSVDEGDIGAGRMTLDRKQIVAAYAHTAGGATPYMLISAASTNATSLKASAGQIYAIAAMNLNASPRYLKLYNKASAPTVGTDTPLQVYMIPGNTAGTGFTISFPAGQVWTTGIAFALTTGIATSDTGAVAANEIVVNINYA